jgi:hypothetical protein
MLGFELPAHSSDARPSILAQSFFQGNRMGLQKRMAIKRRLAIPKLLESEDPELRAG